MSRILLLLGGTALGLIAPKVARLARDIYAERGSRGPKLFVKRRCHANTSGEAAKEPGNAGPGASAEPTADPAV
ncbi:MAG: hypothetical protein LBQ12_05480 [Deltaproteobacteria bacterium]|jgi:hypothetical protein|nr:hypothetical protein [Deltaproteobacteria bacterium]